MAKIDSGDIARISNDTVGVVLEYIKSNIVGDDAKATGDEAEAVLWCICGTIGLLEAYLKVSVPAPYVYNVRAFLDAFSGRMGERISAIDKQLKLSQDLPVDKPGPGPILNGK